MPSITINDVGPRDGLQNQQKILSPEQRIQLVTALLAAGMDHVEVGAFVSPKAVPAMAGADQVLAGLPEMDHGVFKVLVPNFRGYELARDAGAKSVCTVLYGSEGMAQANVKMSREQADQATADILARARQDGIRVTPPWGLHLNARLMARLIRPSLKRRSQNSWDWGQTKWPLRTPSVRPIRNRFVL